MSKMGGSANRLSSRVSPCSGSPFSATDVTRTLFQNKLYDLVLSNIADPDPRFVLTITRILEEKTKQLLFLFTNYNTIQVRKTFN